MKGKALTTLNEKDSLTDVLILDKQILYEYAAAVAESDKKETRRLLVKNFAAAEETQLNVYKMMNERGYYIPAAAKTEEIKSAVSSFKKISGKVLKS